MTDIVEFLEARIAEDNEAAKEATNDGHRWLVDEETISLWPADDDDRMYGHITFPRKAHARHASIHDPIRVLREVAAKRTILVEHADDEGQCARCLDSDGITYLGAYTAPWPCPTLRALAAVYSDHPDYRPDW